MSTVTVASSHGISPPWLKHTQSLQNNRFSLFQCSEIHIEKVCLKTALQLKSSQIPSFILRRASLHWETDTEIPQHRCSPLFISVLPASGLSLLSLSPVIIFFPTLSAHNIYVRKITSAMDRFGLMLLRAAISNIASGSGWYLSETLKIFLDTLVSKYTEVLKAFKKEEDCSENAL